MRGAVGVRQSGRPPGGPHLVRGEPANDVGRREREGRRLRLLLRQARSGHAVARRYLVDPRLVDHAAERLRAVERVEEQRLALAERLDLALFLGPRDLVAQRGRERGVAEVDRRPDIEEPGRERGLDRLEVALHDGRRDAEERGDVHARRAAGGAEGSVGAEVDPRGRLLRDEHELLPDLPGLGAVHQVVDRRAEGLDAGGRLSAREGL